MVKSGPTPSVGRVIAGPWRCGRLAILAGGRSPRKASRPAKFRAMATSATALPRRNFNRWWSRRNSGSPREAFKSARLTGADAVNQSFWRPATSSIHPLVSLTALPNSSKTKKAGCNRSSRVYTGGTQDGKAEILVE